MHFESHELQPIPELHLSPEGYVAGTCGHAPPRFGCEACIAAAQPVSSLFELSWDELDVLIDRFTAECVADFGWPLRFQPLVADFLRERLR